MHSTQIVRLVMLCAITSLGATTCYAQSPRQVEIKVLTDQDEPLAGATVLVRPSLMRTVGDEYAFNDKPPVLPHELATTDAAGQATIDVTKLLGQEAEAPLSVSVWKAGYGMQSISVQKKAELRCWPVRKRTVQLINAQDQPLQGVRVEHTSGWESVLDEAQYRWWTDEPAITDEFGLTTLEAHASGYLSMTITESDGTVHRSTVNEINRVSGRLPDLRDLSIIRLQSHGKIEGKLPPEFAQEFGVRVIRDFRASDLRFGTSMTSLSNSQAQVDQEGNFRFDAVAEGANWVVVYRREPLDASKATAPTRQPVALHRVDVQAGKTAMLQIDTLPVAKVSGRVVCPEATSDFSELRLLISKSTANDADSRNPQMHPVERVECQADGSFACWLPVGRYQITVAPSNPWRVNAALDFQVGAGAVNIATSDLRVAEYRPAKVTWQHTYRAANSILSSTDNRLVFRSKDKYAGTCTLTADGYGTVYLMPNEEVTQISRDGILPNSQAAISAFIDRDPSENFELELNKEARGTSSNIALRGRVVDAAGNGMGRIPVTITLAYEAVGNAAGRSPMQTASQMLDVVMSERDGSFQIPPRQLLSRLTIPGRDTAAEAKFVFTVSTPANPQPIEVQKSYTLKPEEWNEAEIEFPDLVIDRPLGGNRLSGKVLDANGQPSAGELLRLADKRHIVRTLSGRDGQFAIEDLAGPTWLMRETDWSIRAVNDYAQPVTCSFGEKSAAPADGSGWKRMERDQRIKLAKELLQAVPMPQAALGFVQARNAPASDDFYLEPDKTLDQLLRLKGANADLLRMQFISFWSNLSDEKMRSLAEAMSQNAYRVQVMLLLADRHPNVEAYEQAMQAIEYPVGPDRRDFMASQVIDVLANVGLKLHAYGALEPYRGKSRQFLEQQAIEAAKVQPNPAGNLGLPNISVLNQERPSLHLCRALLDPEQFAGGVLESVTGSFTELSNEDRMAQMRDVDMFLRLYPAEFGRLPADRVSFSDEGLANLGIQSPLKALEAVKQGRLPAESLRVVSTAALASNHPDAEQLLRESAKLWLRSDTTRSRFPISLFGMFVRQPDLVWYQAAKNKSPELARLAAWHLAHDYLSGKYDDNGITILPTRERAAPQALSTAYCLNEDFHELAYHVAQRQVPRLLATTEQDFGLTFSRNGDFSVAAWFDPQATADVVIKLKKRIDEERKNQAGGPRDPRVFAKENELASLRFTCLRGLLLDEL